MIAVEAPPKPAAPETKAPSVPRGSGKNPSETPPRHTPSGAKRPSLPRKKTHPDIEGTLDKPRTPEHRFLQRTVAEEMQATGEYQRIGTNMSLSEFSGSRHSPDIRPDNIGLTVEGRIDMIEIRSPGQSLDELQDKLRKAMNRLPERMRGEWLVIDPEDAFK